MTSIGIVEKIENRDITVKFYKEAGCKGCQGCGPESKFGNTVTIQSDNYAKYSVGEEVTVEIENETLVKFSLIAYVLPAIMLIVGYFIGTLFSDSEGVAVLSSFIGLGASFLFVYFYDKFKITDEVTNLTLL